MGSTWASDSFFGANRSIGMIPNRYWTAIDQREHGRHRREDDARLSHPRRPRHGPRRPEPAEERIGREVAHERPVRQDRPDGRDGREQRQGRDRLAEEEPLGLARLAADQPPDRRDEADHEHHPDPRQQVGRLAADRREHRERPQPDPAHRAAALEGERCPVVGRVPCQDGGEHGNADQGRQVGAGRLQDPPGRRRRARGRPARPSAGTPRDTCSAAPRPRPGRPGAIARDAPESPARG